MLHHEQQKKDINTSMRAARYGCRERGQRSVRERRAARRESAAKFVMQMPHHADRVKSGGSVLPRKSRSPKPNRLLLRPAHPHSASRSLPDMRSAMLTAGGEPRRSAEAHRPLVCIFCPHARYARLRPRTATARARAC